mgnify:CR=1 FL=1
MKNKLTNKKASYIFGILDELVKAERARAVEIIEEVEDYLSNTDFKKNESLQINTMIGLARYHINGKDTRAATEVLQRAMDIAESLNAPDHIFDAGRPSESHQYLGRDVGAIGQASRKMVGNC